MKTASVFSRGFFAKAKKALSQGFLSQQKGSIFSQGFLSQQKGLIFSQGFFQQKKGFVISIDAMLALVIILVMFAGITFYLSSINFEAGTKVLLREMGMDAVTTLEKNGTLENAVRTSNTTEISSFLSQMPNSICGDLKVFNESDLNNHIFLVAKSGCLKNFEDSATINRSFVVRNGSNADMHLARMTIWYKVT